MARIRPLSAGQQKFLQLLMAHHLLSDSDAQTLFTHLSSDQDNGTMGRTLEQCLGMINASLSPAFGLEIKTMSIDKRCAGLGDELANDDSESQTADGSATASADKSSKSSRARGGGPKHTVRYHCVVNTTSDGPSKSTFAHKEGGNPHHGPSIRSPHEIAYLRLIVEKLIERGLDMEEHGSVDGWGAGSRGCMGRIAVLNLVKELEGNHAGKLTVGQAERCVSGLVAEKWLVSASPLDDEEEDDDEDVEMEGEEGEGTEGSAQKKRRRGGRKSKKGRTSLDGLGGESAGDGKSHLMIGPRTYMELPDLLKDVGLERVPQFILHSAR